MPPRRTAASAAALIAAIAAATALAPAVAAAPAYRPGEVVVTFAPDASYAQAARTVAGAGTAAIAAPQPGERVLAITDGSSVAETAAELRARPDVLTAVPNFIARASGYIPNDPGAARQRGGWTRMQWNLAGPASVKAPDAWSQLIASGRYGGRGAVVAVLDTGVAYENFGPFRRSPDFASWQFVGGADFVDRDFHPNDDNGHGTFIAGVIASRTNNGLGLAGLAYGARIMPVRVLDAEGLGDASAIAAGIRFAALRGAHVINLSLEFDAALPASAIPGVIRAIRFARLRGSLVIGAAGNQAARAIAYPARAAGATSVGATTEHGCVADYSNRGIGLDLVAPGGGADGIDAANPDCMPFAAPGRDIFSVSFIGASIRRFGYPRGFEGTSMAAPHVAAAAALVIGGGVLGPRAGATAVERHLKRTARDLGEPGYDERYGYGLVDAAAATAPLG